MIPIFRRLKDLSYRRVESTADGRADNNLEDYDDTDGPQHPPKRSRYEETDQNIPSVSGLFAPPPPQPTSVVNAEDQVLFSSNNFCAPFVL